VSTGGADRIHALSERLANQIAAGEVVERPASVLKELLENSLDAGAARISVDIERGGTRLIRVRDDGRGIHRDDLALALDRHATSKIATLDDLMNVSSLGFRGEALPSIASVSRLELSSCAQGEESGWKLAADASHGEASTQPVAHPKGTTVTVRDLFYNTPARRKFMRTEKTEYRHIEDVLKRAALSRFDCAFSLRHNARQSFSVPAASSDAERARRVAKLCGGAFMDRALALAFEAEGLRLEGWIGEPGYDRGVSDLQYFFVNARMVKDNLLRHAVRHAHDGVVERGRQPAYVLFLYLDPAQVDVNVHPSKHEVRFRDGRSVHEFIARSLRRALSPETASIDRMTAEALSATAPPGRPRPGQVRDQASAYDALRAGIGEGSRPVDAPLGDVVQHVDRRYVVARNAHGLVVVDARRGCRRVAAERLSAAMAGGRISARPLLVPVAVAVDERRADRLESSASLLESLGFDVRRVARDSVSCRGIPAPLANASPEALVVTIADALADALADAVADAPAHADAGDHAADRLPAVLETVLERCDLTAGWSWERAVMNELLRDLERLENASRGRAGEVIWRQLEADDFAALLAGARHLDHDVPVT
jgi:DNA mismatch repair protein MutL